MTDLAITEFKKQLIEYYACFTALYGEALSMVDAENYPIVREVDIINIIEKYGLVNTGDSKSVRK